MIRKRVAILISGRGSNMQALIAAAGDRSYPAEIALVISNRPDASGLALATAAGVSAQTVDHRSFGGDRLAFEQAVEVELARHRIEIICLAGFMRVLSPWFVTRFEGRMLNIHPALLPAFKGLNTHARALEAGVKIHGATVHLVNAELDSGPIVAQAALAVNDDDTPDTLAARVLALEHRLYPAALSLLAANRVQVHQGRCLIDGAARQDGVLMAPDM